MNYRIFSPSPMVREWHVPQYLRGIPDLYMMAGLGQDPGTDTSSFDLSMPSPIDPTLSMPGMVPPPVDPNSIPGGAPMMFSHDPNQALIDAGFSPSDASTISDLAAKGWLNQTDWNDLMAGNVTPTELAKINYDAAQAQDAAIAAAGYVKAATPSGTQPVSLPPGASPRVNVPPAYSATSFGGGWFSGGTQISGVMVPNLAIVGGVLLLLAFVGGFKAQPAYASYRRSRTSKKIAGLQTRVKELQSTL
jgi:hypothetical protein